MTKFELGITITESLLFGFRIFRATEENPYSELQVHLFCFCFFVVCDETHQYN